MIVLEIPLSTYPDFTIRADLDNVEYQLRFRFFSRAKTWVMDMLFTDGTPIFLGRPCLLSVPLLKGNTSPYRPAGELGFIDSTNQGIEAGQADLGTRVSLNYVPA